MLNDFTGADKVYIACGYTDLRKGIDGLARMVQQQFELDPFTNTLFLFCGRRRDRIKGLYWEKDGFILLYKRLEQGAYQWPRNESEVRRVVSDAAAIPLAHGRAEDRAAKGAPSGNGTGCALRGRNLPQSIENTGFLARFMLS